MPVQGYAAFEPKGKLTRWEFEPRILKEHDVEIEIMYCGICGSDVHAIDNGWNKTTYPLVPGHEAVGRISIVGSKVTNFSVGDIVGIGPRCYSCLDCETCANRKDQHCSKAISTYGGKYPDGHISRGGYATRMRLSSRHVFQIPAELPIEKVAPLLCAGITVYTPLKEHLTRKGIRLGIIGIGGLGHLALQFARALGYWVAAISHSPDKRKDAMELGANEYILSDDPEQRVKYLKSFDILMCTSYDTNTSMKVYLDLLVVGGTFLLLAVPEKSIDIDAKDIVFRALSIKGSLIGSTLDVPSMLEFASKHKIVPIVEVFPIGQVNEAIVKFRRGEIRYRGILSLAELQRNSD